MFIGGGVRRTRHCACARPIAQTEADWQPGVIPGSDAQRPLLDGEPVAGVIAASVVRGWIILCASAAPTDRHARFEMLPGGMCRIYGRVTLISNPTFRGEQ